MIYLDTSVALAHLLAEDVTPAPQLWAETIASSRLLEYELWTRIHARGLTSSHGEPVRQLLARVALLELAPQVLTRALDPFPTSVRTLDSLHLASADFLRQQGQNVLFATYDERMKRAATAIGLAIYPM